MSEIASNLFDEAFGYHRNGNFAQAIRLYQKCLEANAKNADAWHLLGLALYQSGQPENGAQNIRRAIELDPHRDLFHTNLATVLIALQQHQEAADAARQAIELNAKDGDAHHNLGVALLELGDALVAEEALQAAVHIQPTNAEFLNNLGIALNRRGMTEPAENAFRRALKADPTSATAAANRAEALASLGRNQEALALLQNQAAQAPNSAQLFRSMGKILMSEGRMIEAVNAFEKWLALAPEELGAKVALASAVSFAGDTVRAEVLINDVLRHEPDNPEMLHALGLIRQRQGSHDEAEALLMRVIKADPKRAQAYFDLIGATGRSLDGEILNGLKSLSKSSEKFGSVYTRAHYTLAHHFDHSGQFDHAAEYLRIANDARRAQLAKSGHTFDVGDHSRLIDRIVQSFTPALLANPPAMGSDSALPVFVVGMPRSGTTLIDRIVATHTSGGGVGELTYMEAIAGKDPQSLTSLSGFRLRQIADDYIGLLKEHDNNAIRIVDKFPANFMHLGFIRLLFPNAYIIHCRRDVRDVGLSCYYHDFTNPVAWSRNLTDIGHYIIGYRRLMTRWRETIGGRFLEFEYESLVADPEICIKELIAFLDLPWDPVCLDFHQTSGEVHTASARQVREPINDRSISRWKNYQDLLAPMISVLDAEITR